MVRDTVERLIFYVYVIFRLDGTPCYVGKGKGHRWRQHAKGSHNRRLKAIYAKAGCDLPVVIIQDGLTSAKACVTEIAFIRAIGRSPSGPLVNLTEGGEGQLGHSPSEETREKKRQKLVGRSRPQSVIDAVRLAANNRSPQWIEKQRISHLGHKPTKATRLKQKTVALARFGKTLDDVVVKVRMTKAEKSAALSERNKGNQYGIGNKRTPEGQAKVTAAVSANNRLRVATPEYRDLRRKIAKEILARRRVATGQGTVNL